jgi:hypothetical protein
VAPAPRAVAFSWQCDRAREGLLACPAAERTARSWVIAKTLSGVLGRRRRAGGRTLVHYLDLVADPGRVIRTIRADLGESERPLDFLRPGAVDLGPGHIVCGNPSCFRVGPTDLTLDAEWETSMGRPDRLGITALCASWLARYGHLARPGRGRAPVVRSQPTREFAGAGR